MDEDWQPARVPISYSISSNVFSKVRDSTSGRVFSSGVYLIPSKSFDSVFDSLKYSVDLALAFIQKVDIISSLNSPNSPTEE